MKIEKTKFIFLPSFGLDYNSTNFSLPIEIGSIEQGAALLGLYEIITRYGEWFLTKINLHESYYRIIKSENSPHTYIEITLCDTENEREFVLFINDNGQIYSGPIPVNKLYRFYNQLLFDMDIIGIGDLIIHKITRVIDPNDIDPIHVVYWINRENNDSSKVRYKEHKMITEALYCKQYTLCYSSSSNNRMHYFTGHFTQNFY